MRIEVIFNNRKQSPEINWFDVPKGTKDKVIVVMCEGKVHWIRYNFSSDTDGMMAGASERIHYGDGKHGTNDFNKIGYTPVPENGTVYIYVYAIAKKLKEDELNLYELQKKIQYTTLESVITLA